MQNVRRHIPFDYVPTPVQIIICYDQERVEFVNSFYRLSCTNGCELARRADLQNIPLHKTVDKSRAQLLTSADRRGRVQ